MGEQGCDYAWERPDPVALYAAGYRFVCRYLSPDTTGKNLTVTEAAALHGAGLSIVLNWEGWAGRALGGFMAGQNDARDAIVQRGQLGAPAHTPIYFSVDINATPFQLGGPVANYFHGVLAALPLQQVGVYGGYATVQAIMGSGLASYGWQTYAWSAGQWGNAQLRQTANGVPFHGVNIDVDQSTVDDFGQWNPDGTVGGDDMTKDEHDVLYAAAYRIDALRQGLDKTDDTPGTANPYPGEDVSGFYRRVAEEVAKLPSVGGATVTVAGGTISLTGNMSGSISGILTPQQAGA